MRRLAVATLLLSPAAALALNYVDVSGIYEDASSFNQAERAGVSVLTNLGVVQGNPDGTFRPKQRLNRAEFLKIALLTSEQAFAADADWCFPDVRTEDWFSPYVCEAKRRGIVEGYPDGKFHPDRDVNYAEALKMLGESFNMVDDHPKSLASEWYVRYREAAYAAGIGLPGMEGGMDHRLTRGEMARLAAAYRAHADGELDKYKAAERGENITSSAQSSQSSQSSLPSESSESSASSSSAFALPAVSHILLIDRVTPAIADGTFTRSDDVLVREVKVKLKKKITSFGALYLVDALGKELATLKLDPTDTSDKKWDADIAAEADVRIPKNAATTFAITAKLRPWGQGGVSGEMIEVEKLTLIVQNVSEGMSSELLPDTKNFPRIQTAQTLLDDIRNAGATAGTLSAGTKKTVATFSLAGTLLPQTSILDILQLQFLVTASGVDFANPSLAITGADNASACGLTGNVISCSAPDAMRDVSRGLTLELRGDVTRHLGDVPHTLQITMDNPGTIDIPGAAQWSDGSTTFTWIESPQPIAEGTYWTVIP